MWEKVRKTRHLQHGPFSVNRSLHRHFERVDVDRVAVTQHYRPIGEHRIHGRLPLEPDESIVAGSITAPVETAHDTSVNHSTVLGERVTQVLRSSVRRQLPDEQLQIIDGDGFADERRSETRQ